MRRRQFMQSLGLGASAILVGACQPRVAEVTTPPQDAAADTVTEAPKAPEPKVEVRLTVWGYAPDMEMYQRMVDVFHGMQERIRVEPEQYVGGYYEKAAANFAAGNAADIIYAQGIGWARYADSDLLYPLDDFIDRDGKQEYWPDLPGYNYQTQWRGLVYMTPTDAGSIALYYNKDLFDEAGVPYPTDDWTWEDFQDLFPRLTFERDGVQYYAFNDQNSWLWCWAQAWRRDGTLEWDTIEEPKQSLWTQEDIIENLQWFGPETRKAGWVPKPTILEGGGISFWEGRVAMCMDGPWYLPWCWGEKALAEGGLNYGIVEVPKGATGHSEFCPSTNGHTIYVGTEIKDECWEVLKFFLTDEGQQMIADGGRMPGVIPVMEDYWIDAVAREFNCDNGRAFVTSMQQGSPIIIGGDGLDTNSLAAAGAPIQVAVEAMKNGVSAREALEEANPKMQEIIDRYWARR